MTGILQGCIRQVSEAHDTSRVTALTSTFECMVMDMDMDMENKEKTDDRSNLDVEMVAKKSSRALEATPRDHFSSSSTTSNLYIHPLLSITLVRLLHH